MASGNGNQVLAEFGKILAIVGAVLAGVLYLDSEIDELKMEMRVHALKHELDASNELTLDQATRWAAQLKQLNPEMEIPPMPGRPAPRGRE